MMIGQIWQRFAEGVIKAKQKLLSRSARLGFRNKTITAPQMYHNSNCNIYGYRYLRNWNGSSNGKFRRKALKLNELTYDGPG